MNEISFGWVWRTSRLCEIFATTYLVGFTPSSNSKALAPCKLFHLA